MHVCCMVCIIKVCFGHIVQNICLLVLPKNFNMTHAILICMYMWYMCFLDRWTLLVRGVLLIQILSGWWALHHLADTPVALTPQREIGNTWLLVIIVSVITDQVADFHTKSVQILWHVFLMFYVWEEWCIMKATV